MPRLGCASPRRASRDARQPVAPPAPCDPDGDAPAAPSGAVFVKWTVGQGRLIGHASAGRPAQDGRPGPGSPSRVRSRRVDMGAPRSFDGGGHPRGGRVSPPGPRAASLANGTPAPRRRVHDVRPGLILPHRRVVRAGSAMPRIPPSARGPPPAARPERGGGLRGRASRPRPAAPRRAGRPEDSRRRAVPSADLPEPQTAGPGFRHRRTTRLHHMTAPVTNRAGGTSPTSAQIALVVELQSAPQPGMPRPPRRPKCR